MIITSVSCKKTSRVAVPLASALVLWLFFPCFPVCIQICARLSCGLMEHTALHLACRPGLESKACLGNRVFSEELLTQLWRAVERVLHPPVITSWFSEYGNARVTVHLKGQTKLFWKKHFTVNMSARGRGYFLWGIFQYGSVRGNTFSFLLMCTWSAILKSQFSIWCIHKDSNNYTGRMSWIVCHEVNSLCLPGAHANPACSLWADCVISRVCIKWQEVHCLAFKERLVPPWHAAASFLYQDAERTVYWPESINVLQITHYFRVALLNPFAFQRLI